MVVGKKRSGACKKFAVLKIKNKLSVLGKNCLIKYLTRHINIIDTGAGTFREISVLISMNSPVSQSSNQITFVLKDQVLSIINASYTKGYDPFPLSWLGLRYK